MRQGEWNIGRVITRRKFVKTSAMGLTALSASRVMGANGRIRVGVIGVGLIGRILTRGFVSQPDVEIAGISETYGPRMDLGVELSGAVGCGTQGPRDRDVGGRRFAACGSGRLPEGFQSAAWSGNDSR